MVATSRFIFIHLHKTGGQFVNRLLLHMFSDARPIFYHLPRAETPTELSLLPAIGFVRNPWDWYASWYTFNASNPLRNPIFRITSDAGKLGFKRTITNMLNLGQLSHRTILDDIIASLPATRENRLGSGITKAALATFNDEDVGYFTWLWRYMFFVDKSMHNMHVGKMENLRFELIRLFAEVSQPLSIEQRETILKAPAVNISKQSDYHHFYDSELRDLVAVRDREFLNIYRYHF
jgi:hypothetical protein